MVVPFGDLHIFTDWTGEEANHNSNNTLPAHAVEIIAQARSGSTLSAKATEFQICKKKNPP
jgi:hypothetical protein